MTGFTWSLAYALFHVALTLLLCALISRSLEQGLRRLRVGFWLWGLILLTGCLSISALVKRPDIRPIDVAVTALFGIYAALALALARIGDLLLAGDKFQKDAAREEPQTNPTSNGSSEVR